MLEETNRVTPHLNEENLRITKVDKINLQYATQESNINSHINRTLRDIKGKNISICGIVEGKYIDVQIKEVENGYIYGNIIKKNEEILISLSSIVFIIRKTSESQRRYFSQFGSCDFAMKIAGNSFSHYS